MRFPRRTAPQDGAEPDALGPMLADPRRALGWAAVLLGGAALLFILIWNSTTKAAVQQVDDAWLNLMKSLQWQPFVTVSEALAFVGGTYCTWALRAAVIVILIVRKHWLSLSAFVLAVVLSEACIGPVKALYDRPRPPHPLTAVSGGSFPSGHAVAAAVTAVGLVVALLPPGHTRWVWERRAALYASLIAISRTYLHVHFLSDVVAGALLGSGIAIACPALLVDLRTRIVARRTGVVSDVDD